MDWLAAAIAFVSACAALWQATEARKARTRSEKASQDAEASASRLALAAEDTARSGGRMAAATEELAKRQPPWKMEPQHVGRGEYVLHNASPHDVVTRKIVGATAADDQWLEAEDFERRVQKEWAPHDWVLLTNRGAGVLTGRKRLKIRVEWRWPEDEPEKWREFMAFVGE